MPYNPGSAYPRKTVYTPPTEGATSFQRAANSPDFTSSAGFGGGPWKAAGGAAFRGSNEAAGRLGGDGGAFNAIQAQHGSGALAREANKRAEKQGRQKGVQSKQKPNPLTPTDSPTPDGTTPGAGTVGPVKAPTPTTGNVAAMAKQKAAGGLADSMTDQVLTGSMPGETGRANVSKSKKNKPGPGQSSLF